MREIAYLLEGLSCPGCGAEDTTWFDLSAGTVECRECGERDAVDEGCGL